jgi:DNA polymerase-1
MKYAYFGNEQSSYKTAILVPVIDKEAILNAYIDPFHINPESIIILTLHNTGKKTKASERKEYLKSLLPILQKLEVENLIIADSEYFKILAKTTKADKFVGYVLKSVSDTNHELNYFPNIIYVPNYSTIFYDPDNIKKKITLSINGLLNQEKNQYIDPGSDIIHFAAYPKNIHEISQWLERLLAMDCDLTCDIEGFSLKHYEAGIGTISFAWNKHEGIAFPVDYVPHPEGTVNGLHGFQWTSQPLRELLRSFFKRFRRKMIYHSITFDAYVLIYQLFMKDLVDTEGLLDGMDIMLNDWEDTKLITYLATNTCAGNKLSLKDQAQEFAGNYAQDEIEDITKIPLDILLKYNLIDALSTWHVAEKHWPILIADNQLDIYLNIFKPAVYDIIQMQLTGMPINPEKVQEAKLVLEKDQKTAYHNISDLKIVSDFEFRQKVEWAENKNATYKKKRVQWFDCPEKFNLNSAPQLQKFLYEFLNLPVIDRTDTKLPATGADTLQKLKFHTQNQEILTFLDNLIDYKAVIVILDTFIPAFEKAVRGPDGGYYLFGSFNLGGTLSARLSSNNPNLQNIPSSGTKYAKIIKECFMAIKGWIFCGLDFDSLEDKISALTTKDPMKLKVYLDGYDGHCLRAYYYYKELMTGIIDTVESINSIAKKFKSLRQESKNPTFALTYQGTYHTLMNNCGFPEEKAKTIESRYKELYKVSIDWVNEKLQAASRDGYITAAFGLRVRTPLLKQVIHGSNKVPYEAQAEGRTAGNALGQSWCLLNTRASIEFMRKVRKSIYRLNIRPCAHIHDAQYYLIRDDIDTFLFLNKHLVIAANWQDHPDIYHPQVKLGGKVSIFYPTWANDIEIPNNVTEPELISLLREKLAA